MMRNSLAAPGLLARLFRVVLTGGAPYSKAPRGDGATDPRTVVFDVIGDVEGKTLYSVINDWAAEKVRTKRALMRAIQSASPDVDRACLHDAHECDFGLWLRFVVVPNYVSPLLADLRMWHTVWHEATLALCDEIRAGHFEKAIATMRQNRAGSWWYASRKVDKLLQQLVDLKPPTS